MLNRCDFFDGKLSIYSASIGHEIAQDIFANSIEQRSIEAPYNGATLMRGGQAGIELSRNRKDPDFSIYVHTLNTRQQCNKPTVAWETAYTESEEKLTLDVARLLCLSNGLIQLVIAINVIHTREKGQARKLKSVEWAHWQIVGIRDVDSITRCEGPSVDELDAFGVPVSYTAVVDDGENGKEKITAGKVASFQVCRFRLEFVHH